MNQISPKSYERLRRETQSRQVSRATEIMKRRETEIMQRRETTMDFANDEPRMMRPSVRNAQGIEEFAQDNQ